MKLKQIFLRILLSFIFGSVIISIISKGMDYSVYPEGLLVKCHSVTGNYDCSPPLDSGIGGFSAQGSISNPFSYILQMLFFFSVISPLMFIVFLVLAIKQIKSRSIMK